MRMVIDTCVPHLRRLAQASPQCGNVEGQRTSGEGVSLNRQEFFKHLFISRTLAFALLAKISHVHRLRSTVRVKTARGMHMQYTHKQRTVCKEYLQVFPWDLNTSFSSQCRTHSFPYQDPQKAHWITGLITPDIALNISLGNLRI